MRKLLSLQHPLYSPALTGKRGTATLRCVGRSWLSRCCAGRWELPLLEGVVSVNHQLLSSGSCWIWDRSIPSCAANPLTALFGNVFRYIAGIRTKEETLLVQGPCELWLYSLQMLWGIRRKLEWVVHYFRSCDVDGMIKPLLALILYILWAASLPTAYLLSLSDENVDKHNLKTLIIEISF